MNSPRKVDSVYRNQDDTVRLRVFRREGKRWDFDTFSVTEGFVETFSCESTNDFPTKKAALAYIKTQWGALVRINPENIVAGWVA